MNVTLPLTIADADVIIPPPTDRTNLSSYLSWIWRQHFGDIAPTNTVSITYGYPWKSRLGQIRLSEDGKISRIDINTLLQLKPVPEEVLLTTIAHEVVHYVHGFGSPLPKKYRHPHAHQVVSRELEQREIGEWLQYCEAWVNQSWWAFYHEQRESNWSGLTWSPRSRS